MKKLITNLNTSPKLMTEECLKENLEVLKSEVNKSRLSCTGFMSHRVEDLSKELSLGLSENQEM